MRKITALIILFCFLFNCVIPPRAYSQVMDLPAVGARVLTTPAFMPIMMKGIKVHIDNPLLFDFILDSGKSKIKVGSAEFKAEAQKLIKYFLTSMTIKEDDFWVNLSPHEKDRMIPEELGKTALGRDMLMQDYILKQLTASLIYPEEKLGQSFWNEVYAKAQKMFGTTNIPVDTFNKVWIVADKAKVFEHNNAAYVVGSHLKVMLEEDYVALGSHTAVAQKTEGVGGSEHVLSSQIIREVIVPEIEKEVNQGKHFAPLRQMFHSMILASWYKIALKDALLNQVYTNKEKIGGVLVDDPAVKEKIYAQYLESYKKGVFNYVKEDVDAVSREPMPKKYFSGGLNVHPVPSIARDLGALSFQEKAEILSGDGDFSMVSVGIDGKADGTVSSSWRRWATAATIAATLVAAPTVVRAQEASSKYTLRTSVAHFLAAPKPVSGAPGEAIPGFYGNAGIAGGFGTGSISRTIDGRMANITFSASPSTESFPQGQTSVFIKVGGSTFASPLGVRLKGDNRLSSWNWSAADEIANGATYRQSFPFAEWTYARSSSLPIDLKLSQFSPLIPNDVESSAQPVNIQEIDAYNPTDKIVEVGVMVSVPNIAGYELIEPMGVIERDVLAKVGSFGYFAEEFVGEFTIDGLVKAFRIRGIDVPEGAGIEYINNNILMNKTLYKKYNDLERTREDLQSIVHIDSFSQDELMRFNRSLVDRGDRRKSPKNYHIDIDDLVLSLTVGGYIQMSEENPREFRITKKFLLLKDPFNMELGVAYNDIQKKLIFKALRNAHSLSAEEFQFVKHGRSQTHVVKQGLDYLGIVMGSGDAKDARLMGQLSLVTSKGSGVDVTYSSAFDAQGAGASEWQSFSKTGLLPNNTAINSGGEEQAGAVAIKITLNPGERRVVPVVTAWDFPYDVRNGEKMPRHHTKKYGDTGTHALEIALNALAKREEWRTKINEWQEAIFQNPNLSDEVKSALINELYFLVQGGSLLTPDNKFFILESLVYRIHNTLDVWFYSPMLAKYFPELEKQIIRMHGDAIQKIDMTPTPYFNIFPSQYGFTTLESQNLALATLNQIPHGKDFKFLVGDEAADAYRREALFDPDIRYVGPLKPMSGVVHHVDDLEFGIIKPDNDLDGRASMQDTKTDANRRWQNHNSWKDLNPKFVLMVWRAYYMDGQRDVEFLKQQWSNIKVALARQKEFAKDGGGLPLHEGIPDQTYDTWKMKGAGIMTADLTVAALRVAMEVGKIVGDVETVKEYEQWLVTAQRSIERLWNGAYYNVYEGNTDIIADAFPGSTYLGLYGLSPVLSQDKIKKHLRVVFEFNFKKFAGGNVGVVNGMGIDGKTKGQIGDDIQRDEVWIGVQRSVASFMILNGMPNEAADILHVDYQRTWQGGYMNRIPEAIAIGEEGQGTKWRSEGYMRAGAIWQVAQASNITHPVSSSAADKAMKTARMVKTWAMIVMLLSTASCASVKSVKIDHRSFLEKGLQLPDVAGMQLALEGMFDHEMPFFDREYGEMALLTRTVAVTKASFSEKQEAMRKFRADFFPSLERMQSILNGKNVQEVYSRIKHIQDDRGRWATQRMRSYVKWELLRLIVMAGSLDRKMFVRDFLMDYLNHDDEHTRLKLEYLNLAFTWQEVLNVLQDKLIPVDKIGGLGVAAQMAVANGQLDEELFTEALKSMDPKHTVFTRNYLERVRLERQSHGKTTLNTGKAPFARADNAEVGGIDLSVKNMDLDVAKDGADIQIKFDPAMIAEFQKGNFTGVEGVILRIVPIQSLLPILGLEMG